LRIRSRTLRPSSSFLVRSLGLSGSDGSRKPASVACLRPRHVCLCRHETKRVCTKIQAIIGEPVSGNGLLHYILTTMHNYLCIVPSLSCSRP
jgi:hypothetical protein